jgi:hypothetical protein
LLKHSAVVADIQRFGREIFGIGMGPENFRFQKT